MVFVNNKKPKENESYRIGQPVNGEKRLKLRNMDMSYAFCHHISDRCFPPILTSFFRRNRNVCKNIISYSLMISTRGCSQLDLILTTRWDSNVKNSIGICELFHIWISRFGWDSFDYKPCRLPSEEASVSCHTLIKMCMTVFIIITIYFL
jgi:hypothetical protein